MTMFVRAYLRASTSEQDAQRARDMLDKFAGEHKITICNYYAENESGARLDRPELFRLLRDSRRGDVLLVEDVDRLSRLAGDDWNALKKMIGRKDVRIVAVNVPTTWLHLSPALADFDNRMFGAINDMLLDMLAAVARRDYEQRRERQKQGIEKARAEGKYRGRSINQHRHDAINRLIASGSSWSQVQKTLRCSRGTISRAVRLARLATALPSSPDVPENTLPFSVTTTLWVPVQNGSKFTRGKKKVREDIEWLIESDFDGTALGDNEYRLTFSYKDDADLKEQIEELFDEIYTTAEIRNCVVDDMSLTDDATGRSWDEAGGWRQ
ncbi:resolvase [Enterobacter cloacae]|uniref:Resolvase n=1 Tax=Enterobacter cloacae TaxID=550 RepID=A0A3R9AZQ3_ENTCL|nr:resolvase [Enterobacter cloacae]